MSSCRQLSYAFTTLFIFACFIILSDGIIKTYPECPEEIDVTQMTCDKERPTEPTSIECKVRMLLRCPGANQVSNKNKRPLWIAETIPQIVRGMAHLLHRDGYKLCKYEKICQDLSPQQCHVKKWHKEKELFDNSRQFKTDTKAVELSQLKKELPRRRFIAYTLFPAGLDDYKYMLPKTSDANQHELDIQYHLGSDGDTLVIYFDGTDARLIDLRTDLSVQNIAEKIHFPFNARDTIVHVHNGIATRLQQASFWEPLGNELVRRYEGKSPPKNLVISGHSLGGGYAIWFYLWVFGDQNPFNRWRTRKGMSVLKDLDITDITVITYGAPFIMYYKDIFQIPQYVQARIFSFVDYQDPVPKGLAGVGEMVDMDLTVARALFLKNTKKLTKLGSNGPIGTFFVIFHGDKRVWMEYSKPQNPAIRYGSLCLWYQHAHAEGLQKLSLKGKRLRALALAAKTHPESIYRNHVLLSLAQSMGGIDQLQNDVENTYFKRCLAKDEAFKNLWEKA
eukprot:131922_1